MATYRIDRINKELMREISSILQTKIKKEEARSVIVTEVDTAKDLSRAKVYYTLVKVEKLRAIQRVLDSVSGHVRNFLSKEMLLRRVPEIEFIYDDSEIKAREMDALLDKIAEESAEKDDEC